MQLTWLGHGGWQIVTGDHTILLDPFLNDCPTATQKAGDVSASYLLISHGHYDHVADAAGIANRCGATLVSCFEIAEWFRTQHQVENLVHMNLGGGVDLPFGRVVMTQAWHSSQLPDGSYGGNPAGFVLEAEGKRVYFACDTGLFSDMQLIGKPRLDLAVLPIGDLFTMGPDDSVAAVKLLQPAKVAPAHYNTWPPIEQDPQAWAAKVREQTSAEPLTPAVGEAFEL